MITFDSKGSPSSPIVIIVDYPHPDDDATGALLSGLAGDIFNTKLHMANISKQDCYLTSLLKFSIKSFKQIQASSLEVHPLFKDALMGFKFVEGKPAKVEASFFTKNSPSKLLQFWKTKLEAELESVDANIFIPLGKLSLWALTGQTSLKNWRGSILFHTLPSGKQIKVLPTYHPSHVIESYKDGAVLAFDLIKAKKESYSKNLDYIYQNRNLITSPTFGDILTFIQSPSPYGKVAFDIETSPRNIECISFSFDPKEAISIPTTPEYWGSMGQLKQVYELVQEVLSSDLTKVGQNISFDIQYLLRFVGILPTTPWFDTMIAQHSCYAELRKGLDFLTSIYTKEPYYKDDLKVWMSGKSDSLKLWEYNAKDSALTLEISNVLEKEMNDMGTRSTFDFMMHLLEPLIYIMLTGMKVNPQAIEAHKKEYTELYEKALFEFQSLYPTINPHSPKQVGELAYKTLKLPPITRHGKITTDAAAMEKLSKKHPIMKNVSTIRSLNKLIKDYVNVPVDKADGRLRFSLNSTGTDTGRLSSSSSAFWCGNNLQNWPKKIRNIIIPETPFLMFTEADLIGAEAQIVAYKTLDHFLIKLFEEGEVIYNDHKFTNVHCFTAHLVFDKTEAEILEEKDFLDSQGRGTESMYFKGKKIRHGCNYKMTWVTLAEILGVSAAEAKMYIAKFKSRTPNLVKFHTDVERQLKETRTITTVLGRKRYFFDRIDARTIASAVAYEPQETVAHILNLGLINVYNHFKPYPDVSLKTQTHDSILLEHPKSMLKEIYEVLPSLMKIPITINNRTFSIPIELKSGFNWKDLHTINPTEITNA